VTNHKELEFLKYYLRYILAFSNCKYSLIQYYIVLFLCTVWWSSVISVLLN